MQNRGQIKVPAEIHQFLWTRYLPETTFKTYLMVGYLQTEKITGEAATRFLLGTGVKIDNTNAAVIDEKKRVLEKLGLKYPENRKEDLDLLFKFKLVRILKNQEGEIMYAYNLPVQRPEEVLELDDEEKQALEDIRFEIKHQNALNMLLTLLLNSNGSFMSTVGHMEDTIKVNISEIREVLKFLVREGSVNVNTHKSIDSLKKADKISISINKEVFEQKRFVLSK